MANEIPANLTPEEMAQFEQLSPRPTSAPAASPQRGQSVLQGLSAQELADLAVQSKDHENPFDIVSEFRSSPELWKDPAIVQKAADAHNLIRQRGFQWSDLPGPKKILGQVIDVGAGIAQQGINYARAGFDPTISKEEAQRRVAENWAGSEQAVTGLSNMAQKAGRKLFGKSPADLTPQEKVQDLWDEVGKGETAQDISKGHGAFMTAAGGEVIKGLEQQNLPVRPEEVAKTAAGDPLSFYAFGKAIGGAGKLASMATPEAGLATIGQAAGPSIGQIATRAGGGLIEAAGNAVGGAGEALNPVAKVVLPIGGAAVGAVKGGPFGALAGVATGEKLATTVEKVGEKLAPLGPKIKNFGEQVGGVKPVISPYAQVARDVLESAPGAAASVAGGAGLDLGLAAVSSESPQDTQGVGLGTALGAFHGLGKIGGHVISGQIIAPREYGVANGTKSSGLFPNLDAVHDAAMTDATPGQQQRMNAVRSFAKSYAPNVDVFMADPANPTALQDALVKAGLPADQATEWAKQKGFFSKALPDKNGDARQVIVVNDPDAAPHESFHAVQDVLGESANRQIDELVKSEYGNRFDAEGNLYAQRLTGGPIPEGKTWQQVIADKSGWGIDDAKEELIQGAQKDNPNGTPEDWRKFATDVLNQHPWDSILTPEQVTETGNRYLARELAAENFDAAFKRGLAVDTSLPGRLARIAANVIDTFGGNPIADRTSQIGNLPLSFKTIKAVKGSLTPIPEAEVSPKSTKPAVTVPTVAPVANPESEKLRNVASSATIPDYAKAINNLAEAVDQNKSVQVIYYGAEGEPGGSIGSERPERRAEIEAARGAGNENRPLVRKSFTPVRVEGKQVVGWSPDNLFSNANKLAEWAETIGDAAKQKIPYEIKNGQFTEKGWRDLQADLATFQHNQQAGATGSGVGLIVPEDIKARGFTQPEATGKAVALDQDRADIINFLFHTQIPETTSRVGPLHLAGQEISAATIPGRVEVPVRPRGEYTEQQLSKAGIPAPRGVREVNPFRQWVERASASAGEATPSLIDVSQRLNLDRIADAQIAPEIAPIKANVLTLAAGFQPKEFIVKGTLRGADKELRLEAEDMSAARRKAEQQGMRVKNVTPSQSAVLASGQFQPPADPNKEHVVDAAVRMPTGEVFSGIFHGDAMKKALDAGHLELDTAKDGFITNTGRFVDRNEAFNLAESAGQITKEGLQKRGVPAGFNKLESTTFQEARQFQPKLSEDVENPDSWKKIVNFPAGKYGGGLTGWAFEKGLKATPDDMADFRSTYELYKSMSAEAIKAKDYMKLQEFGLKSQAAHEAYQAATGERLDGQAGGSTAFIRKYYDPNYEPPLAVDKTAEVGDSVSMQAQPVAFDKDEIARIKSGELTGHTFDHLGKPWVSPGNVDLVSVASVNIPRENLTTKAVSKALAPYSEVLKRPDVTAGIFAFDKDGKKMVSVDVNAVVPQEHRQNTLDFAKAHNQISIWDGKANKEVPVGGSGETPAYAPNDLTHLLDALQEGKSPALSMAGTGFDTFGDMVEHFLSGKAYDPTFYGHSPVYGESGIRKMEEQRQYARNLDSANPAAAIEKTAQEWARKSAGKAPTKEQLEYAREISGIAHGFLIEIKDRLRRENLPAPESFLTKVKKSLIPSKDEFKLLPAGPEGVSKAWIDPDGNPIQLGGMWHHHGLAEDPQAMAAAKKAGLKVPPFEGTDTDKTRADALNKGFVRIDYRVNSGRMTIEASADKWAKQRDSVRKFVESNLDGIDNLSLTLTNRKIATADSNHVKLFELDTPEEKLAAIPLLNESAPSEVKELDVPPSPEPGVLRPDKSYNSREDYFKTPPGKLPADVQKQLDNGDSLVWSTFQDVKPSVFKDAGYKSLRLEWNESHHDPEFFAVPLKDASGPYPMTAAGIEAAYGAALDKANMHWELSRKNAQFQPEKGKEFLPTENEPTFLSRQEVSAMTPKELGKHFPEAVVPKDKEDSIPSDLRSSPLSKKAGSEEKAIGAYADKLVDFAKDWEGTPQYQEGKKWYSEFVPLLKEHYGEHAQLFAELLAATSPMTRIDQNWNMAVDAIDQYKEGKFDKQIKKFNEGISKLEDGSWNTTGATTKAAVKSGKAKFMAKWIEDNDLIPRKKNGTKYNAQSLNVMRVLARRWLEYQEGPKTKNFVANLSGTGHEATIDLWADRTLRRLGYADDQPRWRILPMNSRGVTNPDFAFAQKIFRSAADKLGMKPDELQAAVWFAEKQLWHNNGWSRLDLGDYKKELEKMPKPGDITKR